jgi:hypothetical protein
MRNKYIASTLAFLTGIVVGGYASINQAKKLCTIKQRQLAKSCMLNDLYSQWLNVKLNHKDIGKYLLENEINSVAIYGMDYVGEILLKELTQSDIEVKYGIDKRANIIDVGLIIYTPDDDWPKVDAIIVTAIRSMNEIENHIGEKMDCLIVPLDKLISKMLI